MTLNKAKIAEILDKAGLGEYQEGILQYAKPCIRLHAQIAENSDTLPIGSSRIGGLPDLPPDFAWPTRNSRSCEFIAQINLKDVSQFDEDHLLPREGLLLFFFDGGFYEDPDITPYQFGSETIIYYGGDIALLKRAADFPESLDRMQRYRTCLITFEADWMLPTWCCVASYELEETVFDFHHDTASSNDVPPIVETYRKWAKDCSPYDDHDKHHLFGHPEPIIQEDPLFEASRMQNGGYMDNYEVWGDLMLLLQISSDDLPGMLWGDTSSLYYTIRKQDLMARNFESVICEVQFY